MADTLPVIAAPVTGAADGSTVLQGSPVIPVVVGAPAATGANPVATGENTVAANTSTTTEINPVAKGDQPVAAVTSVSTGDIQFIKDGLTRLQAEVGQLMANQNTAKAVQEAAPANITTTPVEANNTLICMPGMPAPTQVAPANGTPSPVLTQVVSAQPDAATLAAALSGTAPAPHC